MNTQPQAAEAENVETLPTAAPAQLPVKIDFSDPIAVYLNPPVFDQVQRIGNVMSAGQLVPEGLRGNKADCILVAMQAFRWGMDPFAVAQSVFVVHGRIGYEGKLILAVLNTSGALESAFDYEHGGDDSNRTIKISGTLKGEKKPRVLEGSVEKWRTNNEQWSQNPDQMLVYRGVREWARRYCPEVIMGVRGDDELDFEPVIANATAAQRPGMEAAPEDAKVIEGEVIEPDEGPPPVLIPFTELDGESALMPKDDYVERVVQAVMCAPDMAGVETIIENNPADAEGVAPDQMMEIRSVVEEARSNFEQPDDVEEIEAVVIWKIDAVEKSGGAVNWQKTFQLLSEKLNEVEQPDQLVAYLKDNGGLIADLGQNLKSWGKTLNKQIDEKKDAPLP